MENLSGLVSFISSVDEYSDPRMKDYLFLQGFTPVLVILCVYVYFSVTAGPTYMKHREPYRLKSVIIVYNLMNITACAWVVNEMLQSGWLRDYNYRCQALDHSDSPQALRMARATWVFFMMKLFDLLDTVFFIMRKKDSQVTYLHVYHHVSMPILTWLHCKFLPGGHGTFSMMLNSSVHVVMYGYYLLAALGPRVQKYLWWKKHLTAIQIIQFMIVLAHVWQTLFYDCGYPKAMVVLVSMNITYIMYHFSLFYNKMYVQKLSAKKSHLE